MNRPHPTPDPTSRRPVSRHGRFGRTGTGLAVRTTAVAALVTGLATVTGITPAHAVDPPRVQCNLSDARIGESSGLAPSLRHPGITYTMNDSGNTADVFAIDTATCRTVATLRVSGATNTDWEAIAVGRDDAGNPAIFVADIGNNFGSRPQVTLYRVAEPATLADATVAATGYSLQFADGQHDAETAMIDPRDNRLYVASKLFGSPGSLYSAPLQLRTDQVNSLTRVGPAPDTATDGAFAPDGRSFAIRNYGDITVYSAPGQQLAKFASPSTTQGESLMYSADGRSVLVGSEGSNSPLWVVPLPPEAIPGGPTPVSVVDPGPRAGTVGEPTSLQVRVSGGTSPYTCVFQGLPAGLANPGGECAVSGTPTAAGSAQVTVTASDSLGAASAPAGFTWTISPAGTGTPPTVTSPGNQSTVAGSAVDLSVATSGSPTPTCTASGLPAGLSIASTCRITGTPTTAGTAQVTVTATNASGSANASFGWTVTAPPSGGVTIINPGAQSSRFNQEVNLVLRVSGGAAPYTCGGRNLPAGLWVNPFTCVIGGRAWGVGSTDAEVTATDGAGRKATVGFRWTVAWI
ncbi:putative Ig domain-containing protein [Embleya sp. NBC_00896]|uniref:putative Ig domain-containing protein n=1 Tax=Embleya sp. NBC_00896 TaxID=2975961 RepID=UPI003867B7D7|nr:putative Ig domain-containing protein [Embleya sp. NBC_00896]